MVSLDFQAEEMEGFRRSQVPGVSKSQDVTSSTFSVVKEVPVPTQIQEGGVQLSPP